MTRAYGPYILAERVEVPTDSPIVIPDGAERNSLKRARVVSVGNDVCGLDEGETVVYYRHAFEVNGLLLINRESVFAVEGSR